MAFIQSHWQTLLTKNYKPLIEENNELEML
jgi:hypothetical protein